MPIYAPTLPPRPDLSNSQEPSLVLARFELKRMLRHKIGLFFIFGFGITLIIQVVMLYVRHLMATKSSLAQMAGGLADAVLTKGADYQAGHLHYVLLMFLWLLMAMVGGGLISRDTLYRTRPLIYAHPVSHRSYLMAKTGFAAGLAFAVMLPFYLVPWMLSLAIAQGSGPVWPTLPLRLIPASLLVALLMGAVSVGTSSLASTPRAGTAWIIGIYFGSMALGGLVSGLLGWPEVVSLQTLAVSWPQLLCGVQNPSLSWLSTLVGTLGHIGLWLALAWTRTRPSEATL